MSPLRLGILVDGTAPSHSHDALLRALAALGPRSPTLTLEVVLCGDRASFVPADKDWRTMSVARIVSGRPPDLGAGMALLSGRVDGAVALLHTEPQAGWKNRDVAILATLVDGQAPEATGTGLLGTVYPLNHADLVLAWAVTRLRDRQPATARIRVGSTVVPLFEGQQLWPHHLGRPLAFDRPLATVVRHPDGVRLGLRNDTDQVWPGARPCPPQRSLTIRHGLKLTIDGVDSEVRTHQAEAVDHFRPSPHRAPTDRCAACDGPLGFLGTKAPEPDPRVFCRACTQAEPCSVCHAPMGPRRHRWQDGREICRTCHGTAITQLDDLETLSTWARRWLADNLAMHTPDVPLHFGDARTIARLAGSRFVGGQSSTRGLGFFRPADPVLFLEHGLPRNMAFGVLVHEWTHVWQIHHWPAPWHIVPMEGLAMWTEAHALGAVGADVEAVRANNQGGVYGLGLQLYRAVEKDVGFSAVPRIDPRAVLAMLG